MLDFWVSTTHISSFIDQMLQTVIRIIPNVSIPVLRQSCRFLYLTSCNEKCRRKLYDYLYQQQQSFSLVLYAFYYYDATVSFQSINFIYTILQYSKSNGKFIGYCIENGIIGIVCQSLNKVFLNTNEQLVTKLLDIILVLFRSTVDISLECDNPIELFIDADGEEQLNKIICETTTIKRQLNEIMRYVELNKKSFDHDDMELEL